MTRTIAAAAAAILFVAATADAFAQSRRRGVSAPDRRPAARRERPVFPDFAPAQPAPFDAGRYPGRGGGGGGGAPGP